MIAILLLRALLAGALLTLAALAAERVLAYYRLPRRWVWLASMAGTVLLPFVAQLAPSILPALGIERAPERMVTSAVPALRHATISYPQHLGVAPTSQNGTAPPARNTPLLLWALMSFAALGGFVLTFVRLRAQCSRAESVEIDGVMVRVTERYGPAVVGYVRPAIMIPRWALDAPPSERRIVILHEREHIAGGDPWLLAAAALALIVMPWNAALWWQHRRLQLAIETDCDARVLNHGTSCEEYATALIGAAGASRTVTMLSLAWGQRGAQLEHRIRTMTAAVPAHRAWRAIPLLFAAMVMAAMACDTTSPDRVRVTNLATRPVERSARVPLQFGLPGAGYVRVSGYQHDSVRARVRLTGDGARLVLVTSWRTRVFRRQGDTIMEVMTPAVFHVEGAKKYKVVAEAMTPGTEVVIEGTAPQGYGGAARGRAPALDYTHDRAGEMGFMGSTPARRAQGTRNRPDQDSAALAMYERLYVPPANLRFDRDTTFPSLRPGKIRVESTSGRPIRIYFVGVGVSSDYDIGRRLDPSAVGARRFAYTPATFEINDRDFFVRFEPADSTDGLRVWAAGNGNQAFTRMAATNSGPIEACGSLRGSEIRGAPRTAGTRSSLCPD